jgi:predicted RNase H-like HicB family nuclease
MKAPNRKTTIEVIVEKADNHFWARVEDKGNFMPTGQGKTMEKVLKNLKESIQDYIEHEGKEDKYWSKINVDNITFEIHYDLQAFFEEFEELKQSSIAKRAGLNESLVRQYATGKKYPSADQAKKIENAIRELAIRLNNVSIYAM